MIGKPITGKSFGGCVRYVIEKKNAIIIDALGVRMQNAAAIIQDFNLQRKMRPGLGKAVGHLVLSWSKEDLPKLNSDIMVERAKEYMDKMNIKNTQYVMVRHYDRLHPHIHIVYNRVDNNGKTISDQNSYSLNVKTCKEMTLKHGYHWGEGKERVNRQALKGKEKLRYELYDGIKSALKQSTSWKELEARLNKGGIKIEYKFRSGTSDVQGISFEKNDFKMKGSAIDRSFSYGKLNVQLSQNHKTQQQQFGTGSSSLANQLRDIISGEGHSHIQDGGQGLLDILLRAEYVGSEPDPVGDAEKRRRKRKKHEQESSQQISR